MEIGKIIPLKSQIAEIISFGAEKPTGLPDKYLCYTQEYVGFHSRRFATMLAGLEAAGITRKSQILDVGPTFSSILLQHHFKCRVDAMSFSPDEETPFGSNYQFDLNRAQHEPTWRTDLPKYDAIVFAEVIEHLYTAPRVVLAYLRTLLKPGGVILIQTPNAICLKARIELLVGKHPFEEINPDPESPGHYRESTLKELSRYTQQAGFEIIHASHYNYFNPTFRQKKTRVAPWMGSLFYHASDFLPARMKRGLMVIGQNPTVQ